MIIYSICTYILTYTYTILHSGGMCGRFLRLDLSTCPPLLLAIPVEVPQIRCPQPGCDQFLKKTDVCLAKFRKDSGASVVKAGRNFLSYSHHCQ